MRNFSPMPNNIQTSTASNENMLHERACAAFARVNNTKETMSNRVVDTV